jgi:hypothetical protein
VLAILKEVGVDWISYLLCFHWSLKNSLRAPLTKDSLIRFTCIASTMSSPGPKAQESNSPVYSPSQEEVPSSLPSYAQTLIPSISIPQLLLVSYAHSPPLHPAADLKLDVCSLPNPPKNVRDKYNGTSKRVREWLETDQKVLDKRDEIKRWVEGKGKEMIAELEKKEILGMSISNQDPKSPSENPHGEENENEAHISKATEESNNDVNTSYSDQEGDRPELRISIYCAMGIHRSVAMVESLAQMSWPGREVRVVHRDVERKRGGESGREKGRGNMEMGPESKWYFGDGDE